MRGIVGLLCIAIWAAPAAHALVGCATFASYKGVPLQRFPDSNAYAYRISRIAIDADGAPNAYHPQDHGIDALANAGFPNGSWRWVILPDPVNPSHPFVQPTGEFAGFFLSMTTLQDRAKPRTTPARYVDSRHVPYVVFPGNFFRMIGTGHLGVLGMARNLRTGETSPMIFADVGGADHDLGEVSIKLAENLGGQNVNPRTGGGAPRGPFAYAIFPGSQSTPPWPISEAELRRRAEEQLARVGGWDVVLSCLGGS